MNVAVKLIGSLRGISGKDELNLKLKEAALLREALRRIVEELPTLRRFLIDPELEDLRPNVLIIVNGREVSVLNGLETALKDGDEVVIIPVTHGG